MARRRAERWRFGAQGRWYATNELMVYVERWWLSQPFGRGEYDKNQLSAANKSSGITPASPGGTVMSLQIPSAMGLI